MPRFSVPLLTFLAVSLLMSGCSTLRRRAGPAGNCGSFCREIRTCAGKARHKELGGLLCRTALCETGHKCQADLDSPRGAYRGAFQFAPATWDSQCRPYFEREKAKECSGSGGMHDLCCSTRCAAYLMSRHGIGNWPVCGPKALHAGSLN